MKSKEKKIRAIVVAIICIVLDYVARFAAATALKAVLTAEQIIAARTVLNYLLSVGVTFVVAFAVMFVAFQIIFKCGYPIKKYLEKSLICAVAIKMIYVALALIAAIILRGHASLLINVCYVLDVLVHAMCYLVAVSAVDTTPEEYELARQQQQALLEERARK